MDYILLENYLTNFTARLKSNPQKAAEDRELRAKEIAYYQSYTKNKIERMTPDDFYNYFGQLWAMKIWGNKKFMIDKIVNENGIDNLRQSLAQLIYGTEDIAYRWDQFRDKIKWIGPAMMSEILCKTHPHDYMLWNRRAYIGLKQLGVENLPRYSKPLNGKDYKYLCSVAKNISKEFKKFNIEDDSFLSVNYFIWDELQITGPLDKAVRSDDNNEPKQSDSEENQKFIHNDIRDKIAQIGLWLGFSTSTEVKIADGSKVDAIWEATIGNMGRVIYVFEVQTKGSKDSLIVNLLKSLNNPAVQGVVAVSDRAQLETIKKHAKDVKDLRDKLKFWDYEEILKIHESLEFVNESINNLGLVPQGF